MPKVVAIHSFHSGAGKSMIASNLAALLTQQGKRVGLLDGNLQSPHLYSTFRLSQDEIIHPFADFLRGRCSITDTVVDVTLNVTNESSGRLYILPNVPQNIEFDKLDAKRLADGLRELFHHLRLNMVLLNVCAGLTPVSLPFLAISEALLIVSRLDQEDLQGTGVTIDIAHKLEIPLLLLLVNRVGQSFDSSQVKSQVEKAYGCEVATVLPEITNVDGIDDDLITLTHPNHSVTLKLRHLSQRIAT